MPKPNMFVLYALQGQLTPTNPTGSNTVKECVHARITMHSHMHAGT